MAYLDEAYNIDKDRMYLTGLSMGGYGSWRLAVDEPQIFAAVAPICGVGDPAEAKKTAKSSDLGVARNRRQLGPN